jgi:hypothetical protein
MMAEAGPMIIQAMQPVGGTHVRHAERGYRATGARGRHDRAAMPASLIVLETRGRTTGQLRRTPLVAAIFGDLAVVGTIRARRSQWIRNAAASPNLRYFRFGCAREAQALIFIPGERELVVGSMSPLARLVAVTMLPWAEAANFAFAILVDRS